MKQEPPIVDLCNYSSGATTTTFNPKTGDFTFQSDDVVNFGSQSLTFEITATSGESTAATVFHLNLINPCFVAELSIDFDILDSTIEYDVYENN